MSLLSVEELKVHFPVRSSGLFKGEKRYVKAVDGVSFDVEKGKVLGIVGESGCGKSTLVRAIMGLTEITDGKVNLLGTDLAGMSKSDLRKMRRNFQMIFQDPEASLNPRMTVGEIIAEPLKVFHPELSKSDREERVQQLMKQVGLSPYMIRRYPHEFSGGQRQRICIARSISINPVLLVCDEAVSALDVSIQAQIINLLKDIREEFDLTYLFISHDLAVVRYLSDEVIVMYLGKVVEKGETKSLIANPMHPYTKLLISAVPEYGAEKPEVEAHGEIPSPMNPPPGCSFSTRCPLAIERCKTEAPKLRRLEDGRLAACHLI